MSPKPPQCQVVVVGAGPVGQTAALLLARWNVSVLVVDERQHRDPVGSKAICQQRDVLDIWDSVGVGAELAEEGVTWNVARTFYQDRELFRTEYVDAGESPFPPFVNVSQARTEKMLDERLDADPHIQVLWGHAVSQIVEREGRVQVHCLTDGGDVVVECDYVVACPGARGHEIRRMLGVRFNGKTYGDQFLICDIRADLPGWEHERRFYFDPKWNPGRQVLIHPCPDSTFRIDWQVPDDFDLEAEERSGALHRRIRHIVGERPYEVIWKSVYRFHSRLVERMRVGRVLLAGDGAHLVSPFGARGLNSGVQDAENAAWKLAYVINGWATDDLLETYHQERHEAALENLEVTENTMRFLVPQSRDDHDRRTLALERAKIDGENRREVDSGRLAEPFWYTTSPLTTLDARRPFVGRPQAGTAPPPGPGVLVPDFPVAVDGTAPVSRMRQLARLGMTILFGEDVDAYAVALATTSVPGPVSAHALRLVPNAASVLRAAADEVWVVRPDGHVAAVLSDPDAGRLQEAMLRAIGRKDCR